MNVEMKYVSQLAQTQQDGNSRERNSKFVEENVTKPRICQHSLGLKSWI